MGLFSKNSSKIEFQNKISKFQGEMGDDLQKEYVNLSKLTNSMLNTFCDVQHKFTYEECEF